MFSSSNNIGGSNKVKRRSFFLWGNSGTSSSSDGQSTKATNSTSNSGSSNGNSSKLSARPSNTKSSPMKTALDKKPISNRNPFVQSDNPATTSRGKSATEKHSTPKKSLTSDKHKICSPQDTSIAGVQNKYSSSRLSSNDKRRDSPLAYHRRTSSSHTTSSEKTKGSSSHEQAPSQTSSYSQKRATGSSDRQKPSASSTVSSSPTKLTDKDIFSSSSPFKRELNGPSSMSSSMSSPSPVQKPPRVRRPPPPVDLSILRNSLKRVPEDRKLEDKQVFKKEDLPLPEELPEDAINLSYTERALPLFTPQDAKKEYKEKEGGEARDTETDFNPKQHRRQRSEAEKFEEELDYFIKEHSTVQDSSASSLERFPEEELNRETEFQNDANSNLVLPKDVNSQNLGRSLSTYVDPLKVPEISQHDGLSSPSRLAPPPVLTSLSTARSEPLSGPPPLPPKEPLESVKTISSSPQSMFKTEGESKGLSEAEVGKRESGTSGAGDECADRFSFTDSLADNSVKSIQQVALDDTRGAAPIVSNLSYRDSIDFTAYADNNNDTSHMHANGLDKPPLMNNFPQQHNQLNHNEDYQGETKSFKHPPLDIATYDKKGEHKIVDLDGNSSGGIFDKKSAMHPVKSEKVPPPRRKFRVVNEDRPTFYMNGYDEPLRKNNNDFDDTATDYSSRSQESAYSKNDSITPSEKSNTFVPMNSSNQGLDRKPASFGIRSGYMNLDSESEKEISKSIDSSSKTKERFDTPSSLSNHQSTRSNKSNNSSTTVSSGSPWPDKSVRLVSSYVEELRLKYYRASNFLQAPPNLPITLKQKNNLVQPKNVKVKIRTSSKQIGIKHGRAKQKLLTLETTDEDINEGGPMRASGNENRINVDHTREFHNLLNHKTSSNKSISQDQSPSKSKDDDDPEEYLHTIPGDDAYDSDDAMAPLREREDSDDAGVTRSNTVKSYFTKQQEKLQHINDSSRYEKLPSNINIQDYLDKDPISKTLSTQSGDSRLEEPFAYGQGLRVTNPDSSPD